MLHQILNILDAFCIHTSVSNEQDAPVDASGVCQYFSNITSRNMCKISHFHASDDHFAFSKHNDRMQKQGVAENLCSFGDLPCLAHNVSAVNDKSRGNIASQLFHSIYDICLEACFSAIEAAYSTISPILLERCPESITVTFSKDFAASRALKYPWLACFAIVM